MIEGIDYCYIYPKNEKDVTHIKLLDGPYKGTVFKYGKVSIKEINGQGHLIFSYDVLESPVSKLKKLNRSEQFKQVAGDLLVEIMTSNMDQEFIDENRTDDFEESDQE